MSDDDERRTLAAMEEMLALQDPGFEARVRRRHGWRRRWPVITAAVGVVLVVGLAGLGLVAEALLVATLTATAAGPGLRRLRRRAGEGPGPDDVPRRT